ncbi:MAG: T9SS type A sorting domain-containing protein [Bacteroidia bacterium]|nr:T9SS type A sorting domain-containing protein [Bacteroidia bacterium]
MTGISPKGGNTHIKFLLCCSFFAIFFSSYSQLSPGIEWQKSTWSPRGLDGQLQGQHQSGEEWWYSHKNVLNAAGQHTAYITCGYTNLVSTAATFTAAQLMYNEGPDSPYNPIDTSTFNYNTLPEGCEDRDYVGEHRTPSRGNVGLNDLYGNMIYCKPKTVGAIEEVIQDPQNLDYAYIVGVHLGVRPYKDKVNFVHYNQTAINPNDNFSITKLAVTNYTNEIGHLYVAKIHIVTGVVIWEGLYGYIDYVQSPLLAYQCKSYGYDIIKSSNGNLVATGYAQLNAKNDSPGYPFLLEIDPVNGYLLKKTILPLSGSNIASTTNAGSSYVSSGIGHSLVEILSTGDYAIATTYYFGNTGAEDQNNAFIWCVDQNLEINTNWKKNPIQIAGVGPNYNSNVWEIKYHKALGQLLIPVVRDCESCGSAGRNYGKGFVYRYNPNGTISNDGTNPSPMGNVNAYDLRIGVEETDDGGFIAVSSVRPPSADHTYPTDAELGYLVGCPDVEFSDWDTDALVVKFTASGATHWSKTFDLAEKRPRQTPPGDLKRQECMYKITQTQDGGYTISGNSSGNFDDNYMAKLYNECNSQQTYTTGPNNVIDLTVNTTWDSSETVIGKIVVHPGVVFTIKGQNTLIRFADSKLTGIETNITVMLGGLLKVIDGAQLTSIDNAICTNSKWDGVKRTASPADENSLLVFPNPATENFSILYNGEDLVEATYVVADVLGKELKRGTIAPNVSQDINTSTFSEGVYFVFLSKNKEVVKKQKLVVLR